MSPMHLLRSRVWRWPFVLGLLSAFGLVSALVADGIWDAASWGGLGVPVLVCAWLGLRRRSPPR